MRNVEGYGLNDVCVDSWSKVRNLSAFFSSAIADFGGKTHPNGRIPGGLSRFSTVEREKKNVDKTECRAQSVCFEARQLCGASGVDPASHDSPYLGLLCVQPSQSRSGDQTHA